MVYVRLISIIAASITLCATYGNAYTQKHPKVIERDVAILGGGSSGVYTALRLRDHKKSVIVLERQNKLGGHSDTYIAPNGYALNMGVVVWGNTSIVRDYFKRFNVPLVTSGAGTATTKYINFDTGKSVDYEPPSQDKLATAFENYSKQLAKYPSLQEGFNMTYPVAPDLLLPYPEFLKKHHCTALLETSFAVNQGYSPLLNISTLYMLKYLNTVELHSLQTGFLTTKHHNTQELYHKAHKALGDDALLNAHISHVDRPKQGRSTVTLTTPTGPVIVRAKKLVFALQPHAIDFTGLTPSEKSLFAQFSQNGYYSAVLNNTQLPSSVSFQGADPHNPHGIPAGPDGSPGAYSVSTNAPTNLTQVYYGTTAPRPAADVKADILAVVKRLQAHNGYPVTNAHVVAFADHSPFNAMVSNDAIKSKFYKKLDALQGKRGTFYSSAAFHVQDSTYLWQFSEDYVVPMVLAALGK